MQMELILVFITQFNLLTCLVYFDKEDVNVLVKYWDWTGIFPEESLQSWFESNARYLRSPSATTFLKLGSYDIESNISNVAVVHYTTYIKVWQKYTVEEH